MACHYSNSRAPGGSCAAYDINISPQLLTAPKMMTQPSLLARASVPKMLHFTQILYSILTKRSRLFLQSTHHIFYLNTVHCTTAGCFNARIFSCIILQLKPEMTETLASSLDYIIWHSFCSFSYSWPCSGHYKLSLWHHNLLKKEMKEKTLTSFSL